MEVQQSANNLFPLKQHNTGSYSQVGDATMPVTMSADTDTIKVQRRLSTGTVNGTFFFPLKKDYFF